MFWEKTSDGKYIWHYGPVINAYWVASPDAPYSNTPDGTKYGVWLRKSTLTATTAVIAGPQKAVPGTQATTAVIAGPQKAVPGTQATTAVIAGPQKAVPGTQATTAVIAGPQKDVASDTPKDAGAPIKEGAVITPVKKSKGATREEIQSKAKAIELEAIQAAVKAIEVKPGESLKQYATRVLDERFQQKSVKQRKELFPIIEKAAGFRFPQTGQGGTAHSPGAIGATVNFDDTAYTDSTLLIQKLADDYGFDKKTTRTALSRMVSGGKGSKDLKRKVNIKNDPGLAKLQGALHESFGIGINGCTFFFNRVGADITIVAIGGHVGDAKHYRLAYGATGYPINGAFEFP